MKIKVITSMAIMHIIIIEISILYTQSVLADCLSSPDKMQVECLIHINVLFSTKTQLNKLYYDLSFIICYFRLSFFYVCI